MATLVLLTSLLVVTAGVSSPDVTRLCERDLPNAKTATAQDALRCANHWLFTHAGYTSDDDLTMDPSVDGKGPLMLTAEQLTRMAHHVNAACGPRCRSFPDGDHDATVLYRAREFFAGAARQRFSLLDHARMESMEPVLGKVLRGERLTSEDLRGFSPLTLWRLRNAVYARHGRPFKNPDLQRFFYGPPVDTTALLPRKPDPTFKQSRLTTADRANLKTIRAAEH